MHTKRKRILLAGTLSSERHWSIMRGMLQYISSHKSWDVRTITSIEYNEELVRSYKPDGIISFHYLMRMEDYTAFTPTVIIGNNENKAAKHLIGLDDDETGRMAARYLLSKRYPHYGFAYNWDYSTSSLRRKGFEDEIRRAGKESHSYRNPALRGLVLERHSKEIRLELLNWLKSVPKPIALFCLNDEVAYSIIEACEQLYLRVPDDVAVLGVGNEPNLCNQFSTSLSSISLPFERIGLQAAKLLDQLIQNHRHPRTVNLMPPERIIERASTDTIYNLDALTQSALQYITAHIDKTFNVDDLLEELLVSRTLLESRFRKYFNKTPRQYIEETKLSRAKTMLEETDLSVKMISDRCGYPNPSLFSARFKHVIGLTPLSYRKNITS